MTPAIASGFAIALAAAAPFADLDAIDREVARFTGAQAGEIGGAIAPVDRRLRLQPCLAPLVIDWRTEGHDSVIVQCPDPGWRIFVQVRKASVTAIERPAVNRGDAVSIAVSGEGFTVSQPGEALESGAVGAWVRVRPANAARSGGEPMRARVMRPGLVELPAP